MQARDTDAGTVAVRPAAIADGATNYWAVDKNPGGGIPGSVIQATNENDFLGNIRNLMAAAGITQTRGPSGDDDLLDAIIHQARAAVPQGGHLYGLTHSNGSALEIDFEGGEVRNSANTKTAAYGSFTKDVGTDWAQGTDGGKASGVGALVADTWYPFFCNWNDDVSPIVTGGWDLSANRLTAALLKADTGYANIRRIGWHLTNATATDFVAYVQEPSRPDYIRLADSVIELNTSVVPTTEQTHTLSFVPPMCAGEFDAHVSVGTTSTISAIYVWFYPTDQSDPSVSPGLPIGNLFVHKNLDEKDTDSDRIVVQVDALKQIKSVGRFSDNDFVKNSYGLSAVGFYDDRNRLAPAV